MLGKHFLYILFREGGICHKMGVSSDIHRRVNDLNRQHGPFCLNRSMILRTDSKIEACTLEAALKYSYSAYNTPLSGKYHVSGATEWFAESCFREMCESLVSFAKDRMGDGYIVEHINPDFLKQLTPRSAANQLKFQHFLEDRKTQIDLLCQNTKNVKNFRTTIKLLLSKIIGVAKTNSNNFSNSYDIIFGLDASKKHLNELFLVSNLSADNDHISAGANFCISIETSSNYKKASFCIPKQYEHFESSWESKGKLLTYSAMLEDLTTEFPVPPAYKKYVGRSFLDGLSQHEISMYRKAIFGALFNDTLETKSASTSSPIITTRKVISPDEQTQLSFDFPI